MFWLQVRAEGVLALNPKAATPTKPQQSLSTPQRPKQGFYAAFLTPPLMVVGSIGGTDAFRIRVACCRVNSARASEVRMALNIP